MTLHVKKTTGILVTSRTVLRMKYVHEDLYFSRVRLTRLLTKNIGVLAPKKDFDGPNPTQSRSQAQQQVLALNAKLSEPKTHSNTEQVPVTS